MKYIMGFIKSTSRFSSFSSPVKQLVTVSTYDESVKAEVMAKLMNGVAYASANGSFLIEENYCENIYALARAILVLKRMI